MNKRIILIYLILIAPLEIYMNNLSIKLISEPVPIRPKKLIIDTDAGADDATAILLALTSEAYDNTGLEILAITCVSGNTAVKNVVQNVLKTLTIANRSDIPVYIGAAASLLLSSANENYYGTDGLGDFQFDRNITAVADNHTQAALALINIAQRYPGEVSILAIGPLTNIALAIELDPTFVKNVQQFHISGSTVRGVGNIKPHVEYNCYADPESFYIVFNSVIKPTNLVPWETTYDSQIPMIWRTDVLGNLNSTIINFLNQAERITLTEGTMWFSADTVTAAITLWPELITESILANVNITLEGEARASNVVNFNSTNKNAFIPLSFDVESYQNILLKYFAV